MGYRTCAIESLAPGQWIVSRDEDAPNGPLVRRQVEERFERTAYQLTILTLRDSAGREQTIQTTAEHPAYVLGQGWVAAGTLRAGDTLAEPGVGVSTVARVEKQRHPAGIPVYNLRVGESHTYFVRAEGSDAEPVWVHNACDGLTPGTPEHKAQRWQDYQARGGPIKDYEAWSTKYDVAMENSTGPLLREAEYRDAFGGANRVVGTPYGNRQVDILTDSKMMQLKTGYEYLTEANRWAIQRDAYLVGKGNQVEWILEQGGSGPLRETLQGAGIKVHTGPLI